MVSPSFSEIGHEFLGTGKERVTVRIFFLRPSRNQKSGPYSHKRALAYIIWARFTEVLLFCDSLNWCQYCPIMADWLGKRKTVGGTKNIRYIRTDDVQFPTTHFSSVYRHEKFCFRSRTSVLRIHLQKSSSVYSYKGSVLLTYTQHPSWCHYKRHVSFQRHFSEGKYAYGASYLIRSRFRGRLLDLKHDYSLISSLFRNTRPFHLFPFHVICFLDQ